MAENIDIGINVTGNASKAIDDLQSKVVKLQKGFTDLKTSIATLALDALIVKSIMFADSMQDLATATGVATSSIVGLSKTFQQNGGNAEQARAAILKLTENVGAAAEGGKEAQLAFQKVGISLSDLGSMSQEALLEQTIQGLVKIGDVSTRTKVAVDLLGKGAKGIDFTGVAAGYASAADEAKKYNEAIKASADLNDKIQAAFGKLQLSVLKALEPLANAINKLDDEKLNKMIESIGAMAVSLAAIATSIKVLTLIGEGMAAIYGYAKLLGPAVASLTLTFSAWGTRIAGLVTAIKAGTSVLSAFGTHLAIMASKTLPFLVTGLGLLTKGLLGWLGIIWLVNDAIDLMTGKGFIGWIGTAYDKMKAFLGLSGQSGGAGMSQSDVDGENKRLQNKLETLKIEKEQANKARETEAYYKKQAEALQSGTEQFYRSNEQAAKMIDFEKELVGKTEDQIEMQRGLNDLTNKYTSEVQKLKDAKKQLGADETGLRKIYDDQIASIEKNMATDKARLTSSITGLQTAKLLEQDRLSTLERITQQMELQKQAAEATSGIHSDIAKQMQDIGYKQSQRGQSPVQQQLNDVNKAVNEFQTQAAGKIMSVFETEDGYRNIQQMNGELEKMYAQSEALRQSKIAELDLSRQWATGWQDAFNSYMESATNAAKIAGEQFNAVTQGMNSAIDKFVETGKFSFSDLANSIIRDLLKIELKKQAAFAMDAFKGAGGLGGILGSIGSIFGFAGGGSPPVNKPSLVGENGPELFVPRTAGTVLPNGQGMGSTVNNYITNNNISAVDGQSVARLFADNRKSLLGASQLAQKEMPYGNR